ncbi:MAG: HEAT repeat domain-containing protein [Polyangiales bacterium]
MGAARSVAESIRDPGYTPSVRHTVALLDLLAAEDTAADAARALLRLGEAAVEPALREFEAARTPLRGRLVDVLGDLAKDGHAVERIRAFLLACLHDDDAKVRRNAVIALGHHDDAVVERALLDYWRREPRDDHRRSIARSLGRVGAGPSLAFLRAVSASDPELERARAEAVRMMERRAAREAVSVIRPELPVPDDLTLVAHCRPGFEGLLAEELGTAWRPKTLGPGLVSFAPKGRLSGVFRARTMLSFGFPLAPRALSGDAADALADVIASDEAAAVFRAFTDGAVRYRIEWADAGHRRGATQRCVERVAKLRSSLVNDSRDATWEVVAREERGGLRVELVPKRLDDPRFAYRKRDLPAASHPTLAAALARLSVPRADDVVWDPFVGSGMELCERALLGPYRRLCGSDLDESALDAAQANLESAGAERFELAVRDARSTPPPGMSVVITNPPLGHRVGFGGDVPGLLADVLRTVALSLPKGGRMVWVSPRPDDTAKLARTLGLAVTLRTRVALAGLEAEAQRFER